MDLKVLRYEVTDSVAVVTMDSPPVNALTPVFLGEFESVLKEMGRGGEVRALVLASACPGFFSAGDDVSELAEIDEALFDELPRVHAMLDTLAALPVPTVAAIDGHALGGGLELALACDFRFMAAGSGRVGLPEVRLGMIPAFGGTQRLPALVGRARATEMMFKGLQLEPEEAERIGLVNAVFGAGELYEKSFDYAARLARQATRAIAHIKRCMAVGQRDGFAAGLAAERAAFRDNIVHADAREGIAAFVEGRKPVFRG